MYLIDFQIFILFSFQCTVELIRLVIFPICSNYVEHTNFALNLLALINAVSFDIFSEVAQKCTVLEILRLFNQPIQESWFR